MDSLLENIKSRISDRRLYGNVNLYVLMRIHSPHMVMNKSSYLLSRMEDSTIEYAGTTYTSYSMLDGDELISEWKILSALLLERKSSKETHIRLLQHSKDQETREANGVFKLLMYVQRDSLRH